MGRKKKRKRKRKRRTHLIHKRIRQLVLGYRNGEVDDALGAPPPLGDVGVHLGEPVEPVLVDGLFKVPHGRHHGRLARDANRLPHRFGETHGSVPLVVVFHPAAHGVRARKHGVVEQHIAEFGVRGVGAVVKVVHICALARRRVEPVTGCISHTQMHTLSRKRRGTAHL
jgi:hypothetical protein